MRLNINDHIKVKLTDKGRELYASHYADLGMTPKPRNEDAEGWSEWQFWHLMQMFGPHIGMGLDLPFETEIEINA